MSVLHIPRSLKPVEHRYRRINPAAKFFAVDAIDKFGPVACDVAVWLQRLEFGNQIFSYDIVCIERQHPRRRNPRLLQTKLPLVSMAIEFSLNHTHIRERRRNLHSLIITKTIHHKNLSSPTQSSER